MPWQETGSFTRSRSDPEHLPSDAKQGSGRSA